MSFGTEWPKLAKHGSTSERVRDPALRPAVATTLSTAYSTINSGRLCKDWTRSRATTLAVIYDGLSELQSDGPSAPLLRLTGAFAIRRHSCSGECGAAVSTALARPLQAWDGAAACPRSSSPLQR